MDGMAGNRRFCGLLRQRPCLVPTGRGWLVLGLLLGLLAFGAVRGIHPFLAVTDPLPRGVLVVEGWATDYELAEAAAEFHRNHYERLYVTGGPLDVGAPLAEYNTYAERGAAVLLKLGLSTNEVQAVPAPFVRQDRTYASATALKTWFRSHGISPLCVHVISEGPHARRSRLLFRKAFGRGVAVGITAVPSRDYDACHWWHSSAGVRIVADEVIGYAYARFFFRGEEPRMHTDQRGRNQD
jgi:hypothetical protein